MPKASYTRVGVITAVLAAIAIGFLLGVGAYSGAMPFLHHLQRWQTAISAAVAIIVGTIAFLATRRTQRITVMIKEQERIDEALPGLQDAEITLNTIARELTNTPRPRGARVKAYLDSRFKHAPSDTVDQALKRLMPTARPELHRELAQLLERLVARANELARHQHMAARRQVGVESGLNQEETRELLDWTEHHLQKDIMRLQQMATDIRARIDKSEQRRELIEKELGVFFRED